MKDYILIQGTRKPIQEKDINKLDQKYLKLNQKYLKFLLVEKNGYSHSLLTCIQSWTDSFWDLQLCDLGQDWVDYNYQDKFC